MSDRDFYFDTPAYGRFAVVIQARTKREAIERFESGGWRPDEVMHIELRQVLTERDRKALIKELGGTPK